MSFHCNKCASFLNSCSSSCCQKDYNLIQLKNTNNELRSLISKIENLSESVNLDIHLRKRSGSRTRAVRSPGIYFFRKTCI